MTANKSVMSGLLQTSILGLFLVGTILTGCGTDSVTSSSTTVQSEDDDIGTIRVNPRRGLPAPQGATAELIAASTVLIRWSVPAASLEAVLKLDGLEIARVAASDGSFLDTNPKAAGSHVYELCFSRGKATGNPAHLMVDIAERSSGGDDRRGDGGDDVQDN